MSQKRKTLGVRAWGVHAWTWAATGAALFLIAGFSSARAEVPTAAHSLTPAAAHAATPATVMLPLRPMAAKPLQPAALHPAATPLGAVIGCSAPTTLTRFDHPLLHTTRRLDSGKPLVIVAIGSSSTAGAGASSGQASYPSRLAVELKKLFPGRAIVVLNRGVNGEEVPDMMARFATGVIAEHPQLVLWQLGTNSVLRNQPLAMHARQLHEGIAELKKTGADVVLIDLQYAPKVLAKAETPGMVDQIALTARDENVDLFRRFDVMRDWYASQHLSFEVFVSHDGLHMNDWGYACWAKLLAASIAEAANPPVASAADRAAP
jgi:acyl-CoA thioesterase I